MGLTTPPSNAATAAPAAGTDAAAGTTPRSASAALEMATTVRTLIAEFTAALPGLAPAPTDALLAAATDPKAFAQALTAWVGTGLAARDLVPATLAPAGPAARPPTATALRMLTEELRAALVESLGSAAPPPLPALDEEAGNVAAALVRWLGSSAAAAGLPVAALREVIALAFLRTRDALGREAALPAVEDVLERAHEVLIGALGGRRAAPPGPAPGYRPDLPLVVAGRALRPSTRRPGPRQAPREEPEPAPRGEDPPARAAAATHPDLKGPMDLVRRYVEDLSGALPGVAAQHFVYPACAWDGRHWQGHADATRLGAQQERARAELAARGVAVERVLLLRVEPVSASVAIVHARTVRESDAGAALEEVETTLTTVRTPQGWRIAALLDTADAPGEEEGGPNERTAPMNRPGPR